MIADHGEYNELQGKRQAYKVYTYGVGSDVLNSVFWAQEKLRYQKAMFACKRLI